MSEYTIYWREGTIWHRFWTSSQERLDRYLTMLRQEKGDVPVMLVPHRKEFRHPTVLGDDGMIAHLAHLSAMTLQPQ